MADKQLTMRQRTAQFLARVAENIAATVVVVIVGSGAVVGVLEWAFGILEGSATVASWVLAVGVVAVLIMGVVAGFWINRWREANPAFEAAHRFLTEASWLAAYVEHVSQTLEQLQRAIDGRIDGVTLNDFIERGVLNPGRDMLKEGQPPGEDVRLSVLEPDGQDFVMAYSAGHSQEGHARFRMGIADSFSRLAYEQGTIVVSDDLPNDSRFRPHPHATRPYETIVSIPLRRAGHPAWIFNAVFTRRKAIDVSDYSYIVLLAAIINVALVAE